MNADKAHKGKEVLISDSGIKTTNKPLHINIFVILCRAISVILIILGILAFVKGIS